MKTLLASLAVAFLLAWPSAADEDFDILPETEEALDDLLEMLEFMLHAIPQYELPEVLENGDIIIRRVHPEPVS